MSTEVEQRESTLIRNVRMFHRFVIILSGLSAWLAPLIIALILTR